MHLPKSLDYTQFISKVKFHQESRTEFVQLSLKGKYTTVSSTCACDLGSLLTTNYNFLLSHTRYICSCRVDLTSIIVPPVGTICEMKRNMESLSTSNDLLQILSQALASEFSPSAR